MEKKIVASNRKAFYSYHILETLEGGLVLSGYEVKSLRSGNANITDGFVRFDNNEAYIENVHIAPYAQQSTHIQDYDSRRKRKILLHKNEIIRLYSKTREKGLTVVPLEIYFSKRGLAKISIGLAKGKNTFDKRESIKQKDLNREMRRESK